MRKIGIRILAILLLALFVAISLARRQAPNREKTKFERILHHKDLHLRRPLAEVKYVVVNFWASWCPPCVEEMPSLIDFVDKHKEFSLISISEDSSSKELAAFLKAFPKLAASADGFVNDSDQSLGLAYQVDKLPETFIFKPGGPKSVHISGSIDWSETGVLDQIEKELTL